MTEDEAKEKYLYQAQRMQTGVALQMQIKAETLKNLRVGVNSCMVTDAALAHLLIEKGIITLEEYTESIANQMEIEANVIEQELARYHGTNIKLSGSIEDMKEDLSGTAISICARDSETGLDAYSIFDGSHVVSGEFGESEEMILSRWTDLYGPVTKLGQVSGQYNAVEAAQKIVELMEELNK